MYELKNYMEILVEQMFDTSTENLDICKCEKCKLDIKAIALNSLKPRYAVTHKGSVYVKLNMLGQQFSTDVLSAIVRGAMIVKEYQHHDQA